MFAEKLKQSREKIGLSQAEAAERIQIAPSSYSAYETGRQLPRLDVVQRICKEFKISADWLLDIDSAQTVDTWGDVARAVESVVFNTRAILPVKIIVRYGCETVNTCTAIVLPERHIYKFFRIAEGVKMFSDDNVFETWRRGAYTSPPLNEKIDLCDWGLLNDQLLDSEFSIEFDHTPDTD